MAASLEIPQRKARGMAPFLFGLPLAALAWVVVLQTPLSQTEIRRYFSHPVEAVEIIMFCVAIGAFIGKLLDLRREKRSLNAELLPQWDGNPVDVSEAPVLFENLMKKPAIVRNSWLGQRLGGALEYLVQRKSTDGMDDQLRSLADIDAFALDSTYGLTRFITWAVPILGFLGTVLGITGAISGVTPEKLEADLGSVTDGLALAFDTTALALGLTMVTMFISFLVEKTEHRFMESVDRYVEVNLSHRFIRTSNQSQIREVDPERIEQMRRAMELTGEQFGQLAKSCAEEIRQQHVFMAEEFRAQSTAAIASMVQFIQNDWLNRLAQLDERQLQRWRQSEDQASASTQALLQKYDEITGKLGNQIREIQGLGQSAQHLAQMQHLMHQNLASLASVGSFDQAMHSLIGAIHLLTARVPMVGMSEVGHGPDLVRGPMTTKVNGQHAA